MIQSFAAKVIRIFLQRKPVSRVSSVRLLVAARKLGVIPAIGMTCPNVSDWVPAKILQKNSWLLGRKCKGLVGVLRRNAMPR